jgi:hypothetical protein
MAERRLGEEPAAARGATVEPGHLGAGAGLVDEDKLVGIDKWPRRLPDPAPRRDIRAILLARPECLFLNDNPSRATADHIAPFDSRTPCSTDSQACKTASVRSGAPRYGPTAPLLAPARACAAGARVAGWHSPPRCDAAGSAPCRCTTR